MNALQKPVTRPPETPWLDSTPIIRECVSMYEKSRLLYVTYCRHVRHVISEEIARRSIRIHSIEARTKSLESFERKVRRIARTWRTLPPNRNVLLTAVTDLAGVRVITFFPKTVTTIDAVIRDRFRVLEQDNKAEALDASCAFGYQSVHYLVTIRPEDLDRPDQRRFKDLIAEIQVRTVLQHAWAEIEHDIQYKSARVLPGQLRRRLAAVAVLLEMADREFQTIKDEYDRIAGARHPDPSRIGRFDAPDRTPEERCEGRGETDSI